MTLQELITKYDGETKGYPTDKDYNGECLSICKLYIKEVLGIDPPPSGTNSAYGYWSKFPSPLDQVFEKVSKTDDNFPSMGDLPIWDTTVGDGSGHIEIALDGDDKDGFTSWGQNWKGRHCHTTKHNYKNVVGWLHVKNQPPQETMTDEQKRVLQFLEEQKADEGKVREAFGALADKGNLEEQIKTLQEASKLSAGTINDLTAKLLEFQKSELKLQAELATAKEELGKMEADRNEKWNQYKNKNYEYNQLLALTKNPVELLKLFIETFKK